MFIKVTASCVGCNTALPATYDDIVCTRCLPKKKAIYIEQMLEVTKAEKLYSDLWVQCQRCQLSLHQDILCTSRDCPIYYRRVKAKKGLE